MAFETCSFIKTNGKFCNSPALTGKRFCYFHHRLWQRDRLRKNNVPAPKTGADFIHIPILEDRESIQVAVTDVLRAIALDRIPRDRASLLLRGLRLAMRNHNNSDFSDSTDYFVESVSRLPDEEEALDHPALHGRKSDPSTKDTPTKDTPQTAAVQLPSEPPEVQ